MAAPLSEESRAFMNIFNAVGPMDLTLPIEQLRAVYEAGNPMLIGDFDFQGKSTERMVPALDKGESYEVPVTILHPSSESASWGNIMVFFHGGGFVMGSRKSHMRICEIIAQRCNCVVVNVEYRMGPEHKFPACYTDAEAVVRWALDNKQELANNSSAIVGVAGDSAGANLSASVCHIVNGLAYQVLIYPSLTALARRMYPSYEKYSEGYILSAQLMAWFMQNFLNDKEEAESVLCSPMERESFKGLPPALFVISECDPLADQAPDYRAKLEADGVKTEYVLLKGALHGFVTRPGIFKKTNEEMITAVTQFFSKL